MVDAVSSQTLIDGPKNVVMKFTSLSDGTGEAAVLKVDVSALAGAPALVRIKRIHYSVAGMVATLLWDATTDVRIVDLQGDGTIDCAEYGGLWNNAGAGITGDINLTTTGHTLADSYTIILEMIKD